MSLLAGLKKTDTSAEALQAPPEAVSVPEEEAAPASAAVSAPARAGSSTDGFDGDLGSFEGVAKAESSEAPSVAAPAARPSAPDPNSLTAKLMERAAVDAPAPLPAAEDLALPAGHQVVDADADALASLEGAQAVAPAPEQDLVYDQNNVEAVVADLLRSANLPPDEAMRVSQDWLQANLRLRPREENLDVRAKLLQEEEQRQREMEQAGQFGGGGGVLSSLMSRLLASDPRARHNRELRSLKGDQESLLKERARIAEQFRDRIYRVKSAQLPQRMMEAQANANLLSRTVRIYNEAFLGSDACRSFRDALEDHARKRGISLTAALAEVASGRADAALLGELARVKEDVLLDEGVQSAKRVMLSTEAEFRNSMQDAAKDTEILTRNFPDKFDAAKSYEEMMAAVDQIVERMPDPIAEEEGRKKLSERMREIAESIRAAFEAILNRVLNAVGGAAGPKS